MLLLFPDMSYAETRLLFDSDDSIFRIASTTRLATAVHSPELLLNNAPTPFTSQTWVIEIGDNLLPQVLWRSRELYYPGHAEED
jgi:hypothetical protein